MAAHPTARRDRRANPRLQTHLFPACHPETSEGASVFAATDPVLLVDKLNRNRRHYRLLSTTPPFITKSTFSSTVTSLNGSPGTATRSAILPGSIVPTWSRVPINSAATDVAERIACIGVIPHFTM